MNTNGVMASHAHSNVGTSLQGYLYGTTYDELVAVFGEPNMHYATGSKSKGEWMLRLETRLVTIYDWKEYNKELKEVYFWHIGGESEAVLEVMKRIFPTKAISARYNASAAVLKDLGRMLVRMVEDLPETDIAWEKNHGLDQDNMALHPLEDFTASDLQITEVKVTPIESMNTAQRTLKEAEEQKERRRIQATLRRRSYNIGKSQLVKELKELRRHVTMENAGFNLIPNEPVKVEDATEFIKERTRLWRETWLIAPLDDLIERLEDAIADDQKKRKKR